MVQFWADFVSMGAYTPARPCSALLILLVSIAPPFIAAYGLSLGDTTDGYNLLVEAYNQCKANRTVLLDTRRV